MALSSFTLACSTLDGGVGESESEIKAEAKARAVIVDQAGTNIGEVKLTQTNGQVEAKVEIYVASPGYHGFHVHGIGACAATFTSAGGHYNPTGATHGAHAGDLPSLLVTASGTAEARFVTDRFTIDQLLDADGAAFILHAGADNFGNISTRYYSNTDMAAGADTATKATGDAGARVGCGVVIRGS